MRTIRCAFTVALAIAALTALTAVTACGGGHHGDTYARATNALQQCCEHLAGAPRDSCLAAIVRVDDAKVAATTANQSTYGCVIEYFACDPTTGRATQTSAQAELECIQDLP